MMVTTFSLTDSFWNLEGERRSDLLMDLDVNIETISREMTHLRKYLSLRGDMDLICWCSSRTPDNLLKLKIAFESTLGSVSRNSFSSISLYEDSPYLKKGQKLEDTIPGEPLPYFVAYPMSKENSWYEINYEERKKIMAEHIGVALSHPENKNIRSYTTYSFGISDGEFMVIYEVDDLSKWSHVTARLREVRARKWIKSETPIITGISVKSYSELLH